MENEDLIREQMEETRTSLSEKLETLESQVASTVQGATANVANTVEAVKETVEAVKDSVEETVTSVKDTVEETITAVKDQFEEGLGAIKEMFDIPGMVRSYPWAMFGGSVAVGFLLGNLLAKPAPRRAGFVSPARPPFPPDHVSGEDRFAAQSAPSMLSSLLTKFEPELNKLKGLALGKALAALKETVRQNVPENMADQLSEIIDNVTRKLGGNVLDVESALEEDRRHHGNGKHAYKPQEV